MEFKNLNQIEKALDSNQSELVRIGVSILFILAMGAFAVFHSPGSQTSFILIFAAMIGGYMALNIGANDVANNVGPAVGSQALTLVGALLIAATFEAAGALIAGGDVTGTIKKGIISPAGIESTEIFILLMLAALLAGALWLNLATWFGAPVSTTHSIVGGVLGAGIAAGGFAVANWSKMGAIVASWVISPVLGGVIAAAFLYFIKRKILTSGSMVESAKRYIPVLIAIMAWAFSTYLILKGLKKVWKPGFFTAVMTGLVIAGAIWAFVSPIVSRMAEKSANLVSTSELRKAVNNLFTIPLIFAAALLSFAHGANDVANAVGPLAAINDAVAFDHISTKASIPWWVMMVGALGLSVGLVLFGPKLIRKVGSEITELDKTRAFCIALAAAITVIIASQLGLPVSSTHIAVGGVFGVGFLREYLKVSYASQLHKVLDHHQGEEHEKIKKLLADFRTASVEEMHYLLEEMKKHKKELHLTKEERQQFKVVYKEELVKRSHVKMIVAAWVITVPVSGMLAAVLFYVFRAIAS